MRAAALILKFAVGIAAIACSIWQYAHAAPVAMTFRQAEEGAARAGCSLSLEGYGWPAQRVTVQVGQQNGACVWRVVPAKG